MGSEASSESIITLPKGGGALQGIGEKFSPDLFTGTGNFTVPIALPAGRNGFQPQINLVYSTGNGAGFFGLGWSLSIPGISRKTSRGVPRYHDDQDTFVLSGSEDLVPFGPTDGGKSYHPRTEGLFARIVHVQSTNTDHWEVRTKDGLISFYGTPQKLGADPAAITRPAMSSPEVFAWKLSRTEDTFGNLIDYQYRSDSGTDGPHSWAQPLLGQIRYVDYIDTAGQLDYLVSVSFEYENRPDPFSDYRAGFEIRTTQRCTAIEISTHPKLETLPGPFHVRRYEFSYTNDALNNASLLTQVRVFGFDDIGARVQELPPLTFGYSTFEPDQRKFQVVTGRQLPSVNIGNSDYALVDLFGSALPCVLEMNGAARYWRNLGAGQFALPHTMREAPPFALSDAGVQIIDANGDGRPDLVVTRGPLNGYFPMLFDGRWSSRSFQAYSQAPSFDLKDPEVKLVDLDGDGVTDAILSSASLDCFFNDPKKGWLADSEHELRVERQSLDFFPNVDFADPRVKWADMTGDGLQDIAIVYSGRVDYWPNLGRGKWGKRVTMKNCPTFPWGYDPNRILVGDIDGDGAADLIYVDNGKVSVWMNQQGNGWSGGDQRIVIHGTPPFSNQDSVRLIDLLGTGVAGLLWSRDADGSGRPTMFFLDFTGAVKPHLLMQMDNHLGTITTVTYRPSTEFYLDDAKPGGTPWRTTLPFPVQVVAKVEVNDTFSRGILTTEYSYHHGYWDGDEREFRGFGRVEQCDTETFTNYQSRQLPNPLKPQMFSPPVLTKTWFQLGPVEGAPGEDWQELDFSDEWWSGDPVLLGHKAGVDAALLSITNKTTELTQRDRRHALRSLRGSVLRSEMYALDGSARQSLPYTVTEGAFLFTEVRNPWTGAPADIYQVFFPYPVAQRTTQWERGDDPLTKFTFPAEYDQYGQPRQNTNVIMPRRSLRRVELDCFLGKLAGDIVNETRILATHSCTQYAAPDDGLYINNRVAQARSFELVSPPLLTESAPNDITQVLKDQHTAAVSIQNSFVTALASCQPGKPLSPSLHLIGHTINHYDGSAYTGRSDNRVGPYGALTRAEALAFTASELTAAYVTGFGASRLPKYLGGTAPMPNGAPAKFGSNIGYALKTDNPDGHHSGYYTDTKRQQFDFQQPSAMVKRGLVTASKDPLANLTDPLDRTTSITYDKYGLLPVQVIDPVGLQTLATYDYRVMQPARFTDANGNLTCFSYSPNGLLQQQWLLSRDGKQGGSQAKPEVAYSYDFLAYENTRTTPQPRPIYVHSRSREWHALDPLNPNPPGTVIEAREFSDGFGRMLQKRAHAEDLIFGADGNDVGLPLYYKNSTTRDMGSDLPPAKGHSAINSVVVSGWQVYDNKGQVVEKYEPFFSSGWDYAAPMDNQLGQKIAMFYDPRGQLIRTVNPDHTEQCVVLGLPPDLTKPDQFAPTPWESYTYDANDLARLAPSTAATTVPPPASHVFTPASKIVDGLGRTLCAVERNSASTSDWYVTRSTYDIRGNVLTIIDNLGRTAFSHCYDLLNRPLRVTSIDAGDRTTVLDALKNPIEYRDSKGSIVLREYDVLNRPATVWALNDSAFIAVTQRERISYGDGGSRNQPPAQRDSNLRVNSLGRPVQHYDEAGLVQFLAYDFKGNLIQTSRRVVADTAIAAGWIADWSKSNSDSNLEPSALAYQTDTHFDALNRPIQITYPAEAKLSLGKATPHRAVLTPQYNRAGALESVQLDRTPYVVFMAHNAKGQRLFAAYGNGTMTRYAYDPETFRLARLRTERYQSPLANNTWQGNGEPLQDCVYRYDPAGNIASIEERVKSCGVQSSANGADRLVRQFSYDPIYRLTSATGRACNKGMSGGPADVPGCGYHSQPYSSKPPVPNQDSAPTVTEIYQQSYTYDPAGNMLTMKYAASAPNSWVRQFGLGGLPAGQWQKAPNNQLTSLTVGTISYSFKFDKNGNLNQQNTDTSYIWDHADRMVGYRVQAGKQVSIDARYLYGADGLRVKKWVKTGAQVETRVYATGAFEYNAWQEGSSPNFKQANQLHVMDGQQRIAIFNVGDTHNDDAGPPVQYQFADHLGSSNIVVDNTGAWINREEYFPYGETSFGSFARKRYRFTGRERDAESGICYWGARYLAPCLARWTCPDPKSPRSGLNGFTYVSCNPVRRVDPTGLEEQPSGGTPLQSFEVDMVQKPEPLRQSPVAGYTTGGPVGRSAYEPAKMPSEVPDERTVGKPGEWESLIPVWGSGREAIYQFQKDHLGLGLVFSAFAISDIFLVKSLVTAAGKLIGKEVIEEVSKDLLEEAAQKSAKTPQRFTEAQMRKQFNKEMRRRILSDPDHPARSLVTDIDKWKGGGRHTPENPLALHATHIRSKWTGASDAFAVEFAESNLRTSAMERAGIITEREAVLIRGTVPGSEVLMERGTALTLARMGELKGLTEADIRSLPAARGWTSGP